jgi:DNA polymerase
MTDFKHNLIRYLNQQGELFGTEYYFEETPQIRSRDFAAELEALAIKVQNCDACELSRTRTKVVFGMGNPTAELLFIGEAPGENEDLQGLPFVGRAGKLLDDILKAIHLTRAEVYIANVLKCRPPKNRTPYADEVEKCEPYLIRQIELIRPNLIICLGLTAAKTILRTDMTLSQMRRKRYNYHGFDLIVTYHPAALLRNPNLKKYAWEDFQWIQANYLEKRGE